MCRYLVFHRNCKLASTLLRATWCGRPQLRACRRWKPRCEVHDKRKVSGLGDCSKCSVCVVCSHDLETTETQGHSNTTHLQHPPSLSRYETRKHTERSMPRTLSMWSGVWAGGVSIRRNPIASSCSGEGPEGMWVVTQWKGLRSKDTLRRHQTHAKHRIQQYLISVFYIII